MPRVGFLVFCIGAIFFARAAAALTISNEDADPHTVTVTAGTDTKELTVEPDQQIDAGCTEGCMVELENGEQYQMQGGETVSIEDGVIFVDHAPGSDPDDGPDMDDEDSEDGAAESSDTTGATPSGSAATPANAPAPTDEATVHQ
jgi:hypothetical protein